MISDSLDYLRTGEGWERTALIGGLLAFFSFLLVPGFLVMGYLLRVLRATMHGDEADPPVFDDWTAMGVDGLKAFVISLVYGFVPGVVLAAAFAFGFAGLASGSDAGALTGGLVLLVGGLVALLLSLAAAYVVPAAILNYAATDRLGAGFAVGELTPMLVDRTYMTAFAYAFVIALGVGVLSGLLNAVPLLGAIAAAFVGFYAGVMVAYIYGTSYAEMRTVELQDDPVVDERAAA
ncbi:DUF4013 domain-containing protein [Halorarum halophilum]|uniref:DUF4013 domain-containing protein n=1 Tax=Halorarum halophilum TaxID=2743090 RepID=A0A7D5L2Q7_9EURY|nr:DUF4013 domain-containing protein [Halobaculum halophilum]QLG27463.1 DUF4013 domain-containing protein [Halobaculum halophilum]